MNQPSYAKWIAFNLILTIAALFIAWENREHWYMIVMSTLLAALFLTNASMYTIREYRERKLWRRWKRDKQDRLDWIIEQGLKKK